MTIPTTSSPLRRPTAVDSIPHLSPPPTLSVETDNLQVRNSETAAPRSPSSVPGPRLESTYRSGGTVLGTRQCQFSDPNNRSKRNVKDPPPRRPTEYPTLNLGTQCQLWGGVLPFCLRSHPSGQRPEPAKSYLIPFSYLTISSDLVPLAAQFLPQGRSLFDGIKPKGSRSTPLGVASFSSSPLFPSLAPSHSLTLFTRCEPSFSAEQPLDNISPGIVARPT